MFEARMRPALIIQGRRSTHLPDEDVPHHKQMKRSLYFTILETFQENAETIS
jgi:hypothetical protein